jgi:hypothetical protein
MIKKKNNNHWVPFSHFSKGSKLSLIINLDNIVLKSNISLAKEGHKLGRSILIFLKKKIKLTLF